MKFKDAREVEQICYQFKLADYPRGNNRARINDLFNGVPPYTPEEVEQNSIEVNVNHLEGTRLAHDARSQFYGAFLKPGNYFKMTTDMGPRHKRNVWSTIVTKEINRVMKASLDYFECMRSKFALDVLHGIGPSVWNNPFDWCPEAAGIEDILVPANTLLTLRNLPFFAVYRSYTVPQIIRMTRGPRVDPGWNTALVDSCIAWADEQSSKLMASNWPEVWAPEKMHERIKGDGGYYAGDQVPTLDCFDFYYLDDADDHCGWRRRIILDAWSFHAEPYGMAKATQKMKIGRGEFLYDSGNRVFAEEVGQIMQFQFADLSAVAPFRYHSVRSLGFLLYSVCHLQNRLRCKFSESVFEALMMYFRVRNMDDAQRALKIEMVSRGFIDETVQFIPAAERFQVNAALVELGLRENQGLISANSASYVQNQNYSQDKVEKTKFQVMVEQNATTNLVSAGLAQAYAYQTFEFQEIVRRFFISNSNDSGVKAFRAACFRQGVPERVLTKEAWDVIPERVMGAGNKTLEMAIAEQLMAYRNLYDPEPQRQILRDVTLAITDDPGRAELLVPESPAKVTDSVHDAQLAAGALMQGMIVSMKTGMNHIEYVDTLLAILGQLVIKQKQRSGMATLEQIEGYMNMAQHIGQHVAKINEDPNEKEHVNAYKQALSKLMNEVRAFSQRLQQQMEAQAQQGPQPDPETIAKVEAMKLQTEAKIENLRESHAQRTAQRQVQFEQEMAQKAKTAAGEQQQAQHDAAASAAEQQIKLEQAIKLAEIKAKDKENEPAPAEK